MKKYALLPLLALLLLSYFACRKTDNQISTETLKDPFAKEAANFAQTQILNLNILL